MADDHMDPGPGDSVSQAGSRASGVARAHAEAERRSLIAKAKYCQRESELRIAQHRLEEELRQLQLSALIEAASAREEVYAEYEATDLRPPSPFAGPPPPSATDGQPTMRLASCSMNPAAAEFQPTVQSVPHSHPDASKGNAVQMPEVSTGNIPELIATLKLPKAHLMKFDGDPMKYWCFLRSFDNCVGNVDSVDPASKLNRLQQCCTGKALKVIECCSVMQPESGYQRARELLRSRFGNEYQISQCWIQKIVEGAVVKPGDGVALQELADDARVCKETLEAMHMLDEIDTRAKMVKIVNRLPQYLQGKWRHFAVKQLDSSSRYPKFTQLVDFLEHAARELNDPVFGCASSQKGEFKARSKAVAQGTSLVMYGDGGRYSTGTSHNQRSTSDPSSKVGRTCYHCSGSHILTACQQFKRMTPAKRLETVKGLKLCFNCLGSRNHVAKKCYKQDHCDVSECGMKHSSLLHDALVGSHRQSSVADDGNSSASSSQSVDAQSCACGPVSKCDNRVALPIVTVVVRAKEAQSEIRTCALLDPGSNKSFCSVDLIRKLGLSGTPVQLALSTMSESSSPEAVEVSLEVTAATRTRKQRQVIVLPKVYAVETFPSLGDSVASVSEMAQWNHLKGLEFGDCRDVSILIGQDVSQALTPLEVRRGKDGEPYAVRTALGWTVNGPLSQDSGNGNALCNFICASKGIEPNLDVQVQQFWKLDIGDAIADSEPQLSADDKKVMALWEQSVTKVDGHYQLDIPFVSNPPELPDNKVLADRRLQCLARRLGKDPELHERYTAQIENLIRAGHAEPVPLNEHEGIAGKTWYLPHHSVSNPNKPGKLRIVFDCSAEYAATSLNKRVLQGPDLTNKLLGVITRFREQRVAVMADIEAMFHQVRVPVNDRDALRFLWWPGGDLTRPPDVYRLAVHLFGGVWSPSCATFALRMTAEEHQGDFDAETIQTVRDNFYVDDCLKSTDSEAKAIQLVEQLCDLLARGGFRLRKWVSNSRQVLAMISVDKRAQECRNVNLDQGCMPVERALGVLWNTDADKFGIKVKLKPKPQTKRGLLSTLSSVYDPLGFLCPYVLRAKLIFQNECKLSKEWDQELEATNARKWRQWQADMSKLEDFEVERCVVPQDFGIVKSYQMHHFCDASLDAYGTVSYLRAVNEYDSVHCAFLLAKSKLAPVKPLTVPRLELLAAVLAVKVDSMLRHEVRLPLEESVFWTDSTTVLQYIASRAGRFRTFVANRLTVIQEASSVEQWRYVSTKLNPADDASRGLGADDMLNSVRWKNGPQFLWLDQSKWPVMPHVNSLLMNNSEVKLAAKSHVTTSVQPDVIDELFSSYSSWFRLLKTVAWLRRFISWIHGKVHDADGHRSSPVMTSSNVKRRLETDELKAASAVILRRLQNCYSAEIQSLKSGSTTVSRSSSIYKLDPFIDDDELLKVRGRLQMAPIADSAKHPVILPRDHHVTTLITRHIHEVECRHSGREYTLSMLRRQYWVPKARILISKIMRDCVLCKRLKGTVGVQRMADLPVDRVTPNKPAFTDVGVDCFGPFQVKRGRSHEKRYGCLFTCMAVRAIHIEKMHSLDADAFLNALVRFVSRRGMPETLRSDNGTNFTGGERELHDCIRRWNDSRQLANHLLLKEIKWIFNPPAASHMGGIWERQIRSVRRTMDVILNAQVLDDERLDTVFCEVEAIVNGRPLTAVSDDPDDLEAITPNHLLLLRPGLPAPLGETTVKDTYRRRWRHVQYLADQFWKRWISEYLPTLQLRQKWLESHRNLRIGDIVLIAQENTPRKNWPLGRVTATFPGRDNTVRSVEIKTANNVLVRPVNKLCLLEGVP